MLRERACALHLNDIYFRLRKATEQERTKVKSHGAGQRVSFMASALSRKMAAAGSGLLQMLHQQWDCGCSGARDHIKAQTLDKGFALIYV